MRLKLTREAVDWVFSQPKCPFKNKGLVKQVCELRLFGMTYKAIAEEVGLSIDRTRQYAARTQVRYEKMITQEKYREQKKQEDKVTLENIHRMIDIEFYKAQKSEIVKKPLAYALHKIWQRVDGRENPRC